MASAHSVDSTEDGFGRGAIHGEVGSMVPVGSVLVELSMPDAGGVEFTSTTIHPPAADAGVAPSLTVGVPQTRLRRIGQISFRVTR